MSENDGITVRQTVAHTTHLSPHGLGTPCVSRFSRSNAQQYVTLLSEAAALVSLAHTKQQQRGPVEEYRIIVEG